MPLMAAMMASAVATLAPASPSATPAAPCLAPAPAVGAQLSGAVLQVMDGRTFCVALGPTPDRWVRVQLLDAPPAADRATLMAAVFARRVACVVTGAAESGVAARCALAEAPAATLPASVDDASHLCLAAD